jgi:uncharacterized protein (DUF58 family)
VSLPSVSPVTVELPELIALRDQVGGLRLAPSRVLARQAGGHRSRFHGRGMEFAEVRAYLPGDDVRTIDWRVTARRGKPHTKLFQEERERPVLLTVDYRRPMFFATRGRFKAVQATLLASLLAWRALGQGDRIGGLLFSEEHTLELRPGTGKKAVLQLLRQMVGHPAWQRPAHRPFAPRQRLAGSLQRLGRVARPGSLVLLLSDFHQWDDEVAKQLTLLSRHCQLGLLFCHDPLEEELPPAGLYRVSDGTADLTMTTVAGENRQAYRDRFARHRDLLADFCRRRRCRLIDMRTDQDPATVLQQELGMGHG